MQRINPAALENDKLQELGKAYINKFGSSPFSCNAMLFAHNNHTLAGQLIKYNAESSPREKWEFLASIYEQLWAKNSKDGWLAGEIRKMVGTAFNYSLSNNTKPEMIAQALQLYFDHEVHREYVF